MCGGGDKKPDQNVPPPPAPAPTPMPADVTPVQSAEQRRAKVAAMKYGMSSSILNVGGARGITGTGSDVNAPAAGGKKKTIG